MQTLAIGIGRNVGRIPMDAASWHLFQEAVLEVATLAGSVVFAGTGSGEHDGAVEESFTAMVQVHGAPDLNRIRDELGQLAQRFEQESIALTLGNGSRVSARIRAAM